MTGQMMRLSPRVLFCCAVFVTSITALAAISARSQRPSIGSSLYGRGEDSSSRAHKADASATGAVVKFDQCKSDRDALVTVVEEAGTVAISEGAGIDVQPVDWDRPKCAHARNVFFSPDGSQIITSDVEGSVRFWNTEGHLQKTIEGPPGPYLHNPASSIRYSPDGRQLLVSWEDGTLHLRNLDENGAMTEPFTLEGREKAGGAHYSEDSQYLMVHAMGAGSGLGGVDGIGGAVSLWNRRDGTFVTSLATPNQPLSLQSVYSPKGGRVLTDGQDGTVRMWDTAGNEIAVLGGHDNYIDWMTYSPDGEQILTKATANDIVRLWDADGNKLGTLSNYSEIIQAFAYSPDSQQIATGGHDGTVRLWGTSGSQQAVLTGHAEWISHVVYSPDGEQIATADHNGEIRLWTRSGELVATMRGHEGWITDLQYSPTGQQLATGGYDGTARLWDTSGNQLAVIENLYSENVLEPKGPRPGDFFLPSDYVQRPGRVQRVLYSADGKKLITVGSGNEVVHLWDISPVRDEP